MNDERPRPPMAAAPDAETPPLDADLPGAEAAGTGDFSCEGHVIVHVGGVGKTSFVPAPPD